MTERLSRRVGLLRAVFAAALGSLLAASAPQAARAQSDSLTVALTPRDIWPPSPVTDLTGLPGAEGQMLLQWTAPDANSYALPAPTAASSYFIRVATFSIASVGGSTTTWWNLATNVTALPPPAIAVTPPTPGAPGAAEALLLSQLEPGVTYYAMIVSRDGLGLESDADVPATSGNPAYELVFDALPPVPQGLAVAQTGKSTFTVTFSSVNAYDLDFYRLYVDSTAPYDFADAWSVLKDSPTASATLSLQLIGLSTGTYHFRVASVDKGSPTYGGWPLESAPSGTVIADLLPLVLRPQEPYGVALTTAGFTATLRWLPVARYADGLPFADVLAPSPEELTGYRVYRATLPVGADWSEQTVIATTATVTWTDLAGGPQYYYHVKAENASGFSFPSVVRAAGSQSAWVVAPDDRSSLEVLASDVSPIEGQPYDAMSAYLVEASSRPQDLGGRVIKSLDFQAWKGGQSIEPNFAIGGLARLRMHYDLGAAGTVTASGLSPFAGVSPTPENMSVYWYNGSKWIQLYGKLDKSAQLMTLETKYFGRYQLRTVERPTAFNFDQAGVSNRLVTPNGDGKNDAVVFTFDNPRDSAVSVRILDIRGRLVLSDLPQGPVSNSRRWDGSAGGRTVPGGAYIYQIESEGRVYTGTIVIIR